MIWQKSQQPSRGRIVSFHAAVSAYHFALVARAEQTNKFLSIGLGLGYQDGKANCSLKQGV
jgi:hypothetical protein